MTSIDSITLHVDDIDAAQRFYDAAFGLGPRVRLQPADASTTGFRAYTLSLSVSQPAAVRRLVASALAAGATELKPVQKSFWGYGGVVQAPDGAIWKIATTSKKDSEPDDGTIEKVVLLIGADDVAASKKFYADQGLTVAKSFGKKYAEFDTGTSPIAFALYGRKSLAKDAGVAPDGAGSHRLTIGGDAGPFVDPDGFEWAAAR
ncbi:VOC family protein [Cellulomonas edaphi]|uniref:Glyoxalase n=1 Tax=Cellulomonas edaphi TaxID=3053468 RepID=A0ABT7S383_9CELL|nr:glyoxalase [Cellulomons edaphi]MDM7830082.1 glyoxalase [Cellulomons edaphi]